MAIGLCAARGYPVRRGAPERARVAMDFVISPEGSWLSTGSLEAERAIGYEDPDFDATLFAVKNQGFVQVSFDTPASVRIRLHPTTIARGALVSLLQRFSTFGTAAITVSHLTDHWIAEAFDTPAAAYDRITELCKNILAPPPTNEKYVVDEQDLAPIFRDYDHPLKPLLQKWRISFHRFSDSVFPFTMQHGLYSRLMIVGLKKDASDPIIRFIGDGFAVMYGEDFPFRAVGERIISLPDKEYAAWANEFYKEVATTAKPRYDIVDAIIPHASRGPRVRYERLLLPWDTPSGEILVTLSSRTLSHEAAAEQPQLMPPPQLARGSRNLRDRQKFGAPTS